MREKNGNIIKTFDHGDKVCGIVLSKDNKFLLSGGYCGEFQIKIWDINAEKEIKTLNGKGKVFKLEYSPNE